MFCSLHFGVKAFFNDQLKKALTPKCKQLVQYFPVWLRTHWIGLEVLVHRSLLILGECGSSYLG